MNIKFGFIFTVSFVLTVGGSTAAQADQTVRLLGGGEAQERTLKPKECSAIREFEKDQKQPFSKLLSELVTQRIFAKATSDPVKLILSNERKITTHLFEDWTLSKTRIRLIDLRPFPSKR